MNLRLKLHFLLALLISISSCTEKFYPEVDEDVSILVVDGKITDETSPCEVRLFRTVKFTDDFPFKPETGAMVVLYNDLGETEVLNEVDPGIYQSSFTTIKGVIGRTYWIEIQTLSGETYESTPELMHSSFEISSIYGEEMEVITDNNSKEEAVGIYFDARNNENTGTYLRWEYRESYEWHSPFTITTKFSDNPTTICYPVNNYPLINTYDASELAKKEVNHLLTSKILQHEVKLEHNYLLDMRLYSVSQENYIFWRNMKAIHQSNGNLYDILPANIRGNISSCENNCEVLGYFEASSVRTKKGTFSKEEFTVDFSDFPEECETFKIKLDIGRPDPSKYYVLREYVEGRITVYVVRRLHCFECNLKYPIKKPSFWP